MVFGSPCDSARRLMLPLLLAASLSGAAAQELLPLGEELPEEAEFGAGIAYSASHDPERGLRHRYRGGLSRGGFELLFAGDLDAEGPPRYALGRVGERWQLGAGGLGGRWGDGLMLGARRRSALGRPSRPGRPGLPSGLSAGGTPLLQGLHLRLAGAETSGWRGALAWEPPEEEALRGRAHAALRRGGLGLDLQLGDRERSLVLAAGSEAWQLGVGLRGAGRNPARGGLLWRSRIEERGLMLGLEGLLLVGPAPERSSGWLGGGEGSELHAALAGEAEPWRWRLAGRWRRGIGLAEGETRRESVAHLARSLPPGRLELGLRQIESTSAIPLDSAPGFPRRESERTLRQELSLALRGPWRIGWRRRLGSTGSGDLLMAGVDLPWLPGLRLQIARFELEEGATPFMLFEGAALHRGVEVLRGRGWRLGARLRLDGKRGRLRAGLGWLRGAEEERLSLWCELGLTLR